MGYQSSKVCEYELKNRKFYKIGKADIVYTYIWLFCNFLVIFFFSLKSGCNSYEQVLKVAKTVRKKLPDLLSSLEMLDNQAAETVQENLKISLPIKEHAFYVLVEISGNTNHTQLYFKL